MVPEDERVPIPIHVAGPFHDLPGFIAGEGTLRDVEPDEVGDVSGRTLLHLQCHIGWTPCPGHGAGRPSPVSTFSEPTVEAAGDLTARIGVTTARFVTADVYDAVRGPGGQTFDIVYTGSDWPARCTVRSVGCSGRTRRATATSSTSSASAVSRTSSCAASVGTAPLAVLMNKGCLSAPSSARTWPVTAGREIPSTQAALVSEPQRYTARQVADNE